MNYSFINNTTGDVGIGTASPGSKLEVNGDAKITGHVGVNTAPNASYDIKINGDALAGGTWYNSDQQFKTDIDSLQNGLALIKQVSPKTYYFDTTNVWGFKFGSEKQYGVLAQELEQVLPSLVRTSTQQADYDTLGNVIHPAITFKAVNYIGLISLLIKGVQEQQQTIDSLHLKTNTQDSIITSMQNKLNQVLASNVSQQDQLNQLMTAINSCCSAAMQSQSNGSQTKSLTIPEGETTQTDVELNNVQTVILLQNQPNPFNERTTINYYLPDNTGRAEMLFYNSQGKLIQSVELLQKGKGMLNVYANDLSSGIYTYTLVVDGKIVETKKMVKQ